jgi:long-chain acyl-CoA synthetase
MTEVSAAATATPLGKVSVGDVGVPLDCCEIKLVDVPEMEYKSSDEPQPRGEICFRGPSRSLGYYARPDATRETIDSEGWLHSGDIGTWTPDGHLQIIDRKKAIFKLAQGEYVAPEKIENVYLRSAFVAQLFVHGSSLHSYLVAVVVPDPDTLLPWVQQHKAQHKQLQEIVATHGRDASTLLKELCRCPLVNQTILNDMHKTAAKAQLRGFEVVKHIFLEPALFTVENGLLTPTMKMKRHQAKSTYHNAIEAMYTVPTVTASKL